eukprot:8548701-Alexandrium_andersonii.AAC.1
MRTLEFEFPDDLPEEAYVEPVESTGVVEMEAKPETPAVNPDEPAPTGAVEETPAEAEDEVANLLNETKA